MASGKLTPRQKMINMMYLVLTALLAMNVSKEILNSFAILNNGLTETNKNFTAKNEITYNMFQTAEALDPKKVRDLHNHAKAVKQRSQELYDYIEDIKKELINKIEGKDSITTRTQTGNDTNIRLITNIAYMEGKDNYDIPTHYFLGDAVGEAPPGTKAYELKEKIEKYKQDLLTHVPEKDRPNIRLGLDTRDVFSAAEGQTVKWEINNFYHNPAAAVIAILTKMQNDVKNAEADVINTLYNKIDANTFKFDKLEARVNAASNYVLLGDEYKAEVFVAGFSTTSNPQIWLGNYDSIGNHLGGPIDSTSVLVQNGVGYYTTSPSTEGTHEWGGIIRIKNPADPKAPPKVFPFKTEYKSAKPAVVVSPDKMNVFYVGVDNPVSISVPGIAPSDIKPSISGGSITGSNGKYIVRVSDKVQKAVVNVSANTKSGLKSMGKGVEFRVKKVPNPEAEFAGKTGTATITEAGLRGGAMVTAKLDNFPFDLKFPVKSYVVSMTVNGKVVDAQCNGPMLSDQAKTLIKNAKKNMKVYIESVKVQMPDGRVSEIAGVTLKVI